jgi:BatD DUF11 like domain
MTLPRSPLAAPLCGLLLALLLAGSSGGHAAEKTLQELLAAGQLEIDAELATAGTLVPGRKLTLQITLATDRWFSGGSRIQLPEVPGLVILQTEQFASNASERRGDQSWVLQRWVLDVYPQRAGEFTIPPLSVRVQVNAGEAGDVEGTLVSPPVSFTVTLPPALAAVPQWVAAPEFSVSQRFDRSLEGLQVGDAFEREIIFEASDVLAMMLPAYSAQGLPGLAAYPAPPVLDNSSNRGQSQASRIQRISYVVQAQGQYRLAAADFFWWDTSRDELQVLSLPATEISVGGAGIVTGGRGAPLVTPRRALLAAAGLALLALLVWLARRYLPGLPWARLGAAFATPWRQLRQLRKPALPERLNPGSSAGE